MISEESLKELIEQKATIYEVKYGNINPVSLKNKIRYINYKHGTITFEPRFSERYKNHKYFKNLFETKEDAEFTLKTRAKRTEYFEPPTWEDFLKTEEYKFISYNGFREKIYIEPTTGKLSSCTRFIGEPTKENYIKACEMARKLFLGEKTYGEE